MNNKKGGFGAKLLLVLILMIASAVGGAYAYRVIDGKMAANEAMKAVENVDVSDYDTGEQTIIQGYIDEAKKDIETAKTRKEVYEIITDFIADVDKVQTKSEKELEAALKAAEEAKKQYSNQDNSYNNNNSSNSNYNSDTEDDSSNEGSYKSNNLNQGSDGTEKESNGIIGSLLGGLSSGSSGN
jgi:hypothetical protein